MRTLCKSRMFGKGLYHCAIIWIYLIKQDFSPTNPCRYIYTYIGRQGSVAISATKRPVGIIVLPEMNLRNSLHICQKVCKRGIHPGFETQGRHHHKLVASPKALVSSKNIRKKDFRLSKGMGLTLCW